MTDQLLTGNNLDITITLQQDGKCEIRKSSEGEDKIDVTLQNIEIKELQKLLDLVRMQKSNPSLQIVISEVNQKIQNIESATSPQELQKAIADIGDIKQYANSMTDNQGTASNKSEKSQNKEGGGKSFDIKLSININNIDNLAQSLNNVLKSNLANLESLKTLLQNHSDNKEEQREKIEDLLNKSSSQNIIDEQSLDVIVTIITSLTSDVLSSLVEKLSEITKEQKPSSSPLDANAEKIKEKITLSK